MPFKLNYLLFHILIFGSGGFDSIFSLVPVLLEVSEYLGICASDTMFQ